MKDDEKLNKELDRRIEKLQKQANEIVEVGERRKDLNFKFVVYVLILFFLVIGHFLFRSYYPYSVQAAVRDSVFISFADNDKAVSSFVRAVDSLEAEKKPYEYFANADTSTQRNKPKYEPKNQPRNVPKKTVEQIDLNTAGAEELMKLHGIGQARANGIIKYREVLGGYYSPKQLYEVYCMDSAVVKSNMKYFKCSDSAIQKIRINHVEPRTLYHPYLKHEKDYSLLKAIKKKLYEGVFFSSFSEIESLLEYKAEFHSQARYYLDFK